MLAFAAFSAAGRPPATARSKRSSRTPKRSTSCSTPSNTRAWSIPTGSSSMGEPELQSMKEKGLDLKLMAGDFATWNYFQNLDRGKTNEEFVNKFKAKYGADRVTSDPIEAGYFGIYLWKQAVEDA